MKKFLKNLRTEQANVVLEYTIVLPVILLVLFVCFVAGYLLYQQASLEASARRGATYASKLISSAKYYELALNRKSSSDHIGLVYMPDDFITITPVKPYQKIIGNRDDCEQLVHEEIKRMMQQNSIFSLRKSQIEIQFISQNKIYYQQIKLTLSQSFPIPKIFSAIGLAEDYQLSATSIVKVSDPDELIRNVDLTEDILKTVAEKTGDKAALSEGVEVISDMLRKSREFIEKFF